MRLFVVLFPVEILIRNMPECSYIVDDPAHLSGERV